MIVRPPRLFLLAVGLAVAAGVAARLWHVLSEPLWLDEAYSAYAADHGLAFLWRTVPAYETHPPFYYTLLHFWGLVAGDGLAARRLPGVVCGIAAIALTGLAARRVAPRADAAAWATGGAVALAALHPVLVEMSREVRPYPLMILIYAAAILVLLRPGHRARWRTLAPLLVAQAMLAWLHTLGVLFAGSLALASLILSPPQGFAGWRRFVAGQALVALAWSPALLIALDQAPTWIASTWLRFDPALLPDRLALLYAAPGPIAPWAAAALAATGVLRLRAQGAGRVAAALLVLATLPVIASTLLSLAVTPVFLVRTLSPVAIPAILLMAWGAAPVAGQRWRWAGPVLLAMLCLSAANTDRQWRAHGPKQDWHRIVRQLARRIRPGDAIWAYPNEGALPFDHAARDLGLPLRARPIPGPVPAFTGGIHPTGSRGVISLDPAGIARFAADPQARTAPTLWLLRLGPEAYDPDDALLRALLKTRHIVARGRWGPADITGLRRVDVHDPAVARAASARAASSMASASRKRL